MAAGDLKLVTDFASLRVGDMVVFKCDHPGCGKDHVGVLGNSGSGYAVAPGEVLVHENLMYPINSPRCAIPGELPRDVVVSPRSVARRIVFKVDTGLGKEDSVESVRRKPVLIRHL